MRSDPMAVHSSHRSPVVTDERQQVDLESSEDSPPPRVVEAFRPIRGGTLCDILDAEYQRCYRFESFSGFVDDLKGLIRRGVGRGAAEGGVDRRAANHHEERQHRPPQTPRRPRLFTRPVIARVEEPP